MNLQSKKTSQSQEQENEVHELAVKLMANWIAAIADQAKNPVAGIAAAAGVIDKQMKSFRNSQELDAEVVEEAVRLMQERLARFDNYLSELSGFTRTISLESKWHEVKTVWPVIETYLKQRIASPFQLTVRIMPVKTEASLKFYGDLERLKGICLSIVTNSIEACGAEKIPHIFLEISEGSKEEYVLGGVLFSFSDNGPGFSELALTQTPSPFFTTKEAGTGLGLAVVEKYLKAQGGTLKISNVHRDVEGKQGVAGALVQFYLPSPAFT